MENVYLVPPLDREDKIAHLHAAVGTVNDGMLNVRESIVRVGGGLFEHQL
jgi:hypothetical protein